MTKGTINNEIALKKTRLLEGNLVVFCCVMSDYFSNSMI